MFLPVVAAVLVYAGSLGGRFVWDDDQLIVEAERTLTLKNAGQLFTRDFFQSALEETGYGYYRPVVSLTYLVDYSIWRLDPFGYRLTNLLLHAVAAGLVTLLFRRLGMARRFAVFGGLLFAVHPIHTENVAWISGRTDLLCFVFCGAALLMHLETIRPERQAEPSSRTRWLLSGSSLFLFALGLLSKETAVVLVAWVFLCELYLGHSGTLRAAVRRVLPFAWMTLAYTVLRFLVLRIPPPSGQEHQTVLEAVATWPLALLKYSSWLLFPAFPNAYVQTPYVTSFGDSRFLLYVVALAGLCAGFVRIARGHKTLQLFGWMYAASFVPILNLVRISGPDDMGFVMAERFCYWPSFPFIGMGLAVVSFMVSWERPVSRSRRVATVLAGGILLGASIQTGVRSREWLDDLAFTKVTLERDPTAALFWNRLAGKYLEKGDTAGAEEAVRKAWELAPNDFNTLVYRILYLTLTNRVREAVALQGQLVSVARSGDAREMNNLAFIYRKAGQYGKAEVILERLLARGKRSFDVLFNLAEVRLASGRPVEARRLYESALELRPEEASARAHYGVTYMQTGEFGKAAEIFRDLVEKAPEDPGLRNNLGLSLCANGRLEEGISVLRALLATTPGYENGRISLSECFVSQRRFSEAREQLETVLREPLAPELRGTVQRRLDGLGIRRTGD